MYRCVTLHQNVNTCSYWCCNVCITHIFCKASLIPLKHDNICFIKNCFKNVAWKFILINKGNNKITELRTILQRESQNS